MTPVTDEMIRAGETEYDSVLEAECQNGSLPYESAKTEAMRAAITAALGAMWMTVDKAPDAIKDTMMLVQIFTKGGTQHIGYWSKISGWCNEYGEEIEATHFAPLIPPPVLGEG